jgi:hypothetical protein
MKNFEYPVYLDHIIVIGYLNPHTRTILIRPKGRGRFVFVAWPQHFADLSLIVRHELFFPSDNTPPQQLTLDLKRQRASGFTKWEWALADYQSEDEQLAASDIIFGHRDIARGQISFDPPLGFQEVRTLVWSCHQPFGKDDAGNIIRHKDVDDIMEWYWKVVREFDPQTIWGAGDTIYADGDADVTGSVYNQANWHLNPANRQWLYNSLRYSYRYHWSFKRFQQIMRNYPHILMWDDHEIHDGWGSESEDFKEENFEMFKVARDVAKEYVLTVGPRVRDTGDFHYAYISGHQANFISDTRSSRRYEPVNGRVMSDQQFIDLEQFCGYVATQLQIRFFFLDVTVPVVGLRDLVIAIASVLPKFITDRFDGIRDDMRDSWMSPGNQIQTKRLLSILKELQAKRPDIDIFLISGDLHVGNAFAIHFLDTPKPIYQITTSAITNRSHAEAWLRALSNIDSLGILFPINIVGLQPVHVERIWDDVTDPNVLCIKSTPQKVEFELKLLPVDDSTDEDRHFSVS